jgi:hypothetical protein
MVIARRWKENESEENGGEPLPKRVKSDEEPAEKWFGNEVCGLPVLELADFLVFDLIHDHVGGASNEDEKQVRLTPNAKDLVIGGNKKYWRSPEYY